MCKHACNPSFSTPTPAPPSKTKSTLHVQAMQRLIPPIKPSPSHHLSSYHLSQNTKTLITNTMAKFLALVSIFALLSLVAVNASIHRTVVTTEIEEENPGQQSRRCREQNQKQDLSHCEDFITQSRGYNPEHRQQCCQQLRQMDDECRCEALMEIVRQQKQQGHMQGEEMQEMMQRARSIPTYCRMERCQWSQEETADDVNPQDCRRQVQKQDFSKCERFIQSGRRGIAMFTSNPEQHIQGCCQQLSQVDRQCRCEALKEMVREQQQEGQFQGQEMQEMMQRAKSIPRMCNMEPRSCQWRLVLY